jgi:glucose dehydrogenase
MIRMHISAKLPVYYHAARYGRHDGGIVVLKEHDATLFQQLAATTQFDVSPTQPQTTQRQTVYSFVISGKHPVMETEGCTYNPATGVLTGSHREYCILRARARDHLKSILVKFERQAAQHKQQSYYLVLTP